MNFIKFRMYDYFKILSHLDHQIHQFDYFMLHFITFVYYQYCYFDGFLSILYSFSLQTLLMILIQFYFLYLKVLCLSGFCRTFTALILISGVLDLFGAKKNPIKEIKFESFLKTKSKTPSKSLNCFLHVFIYQVQYFYQMTQKLDA